MDTLSPHFCTTAETLDTLEALDHLERTETTTRIHDPSLLAKLVVLLPLLRVVQDIVGFGQALKLILSLLFPWSFPCWSRACEVDSDLDLLIQKPGRNTHSPQRGFTQFGKITSLDPQNQD